MVDGVEGEFEAVGNAELVEDVVEMVFDGLFGDEKLFANFFVAETLGDQLDDFLFAVAEKRLFAARTSVGRFRESLHDFGGHAIVEPDFACMDAMNAFDEKIGGGLLQDDAAGAEAHGADDVAVIFSGSKDDDARGKLIEVDFLKDSETVFIRHAKIEEKNFRFELGEKLDALGAVLSFTDDSDILVAVEELAEAVAKDGVVVGHEDTDLLFGFSHTSRWVFRQSDAPHAPGLTPRSKPH